jgi:hypothetical protein
MTGTGTVPPAPSSPTPAPVAQSNGHAPARFGDGMPVPPRRPRNTIWIIAGIVLMLAAGVAALAVAGALSARVEVLVAGRDFVTGERITPEDLVVEEISLGADVEYMLPAERDDLVGMVAAGPIARGTVVNGSSFEIGTGDDVATVVVGLDLDPGAYPQSVLLPGETVSLIEVFDASFTGEVTFVEPREIAVGEVVEIRPLTRADAQMISVRIAELYAAEVSQVAHEDRLRLAKLEDPDLEETVSPLDPVEPAEAIDPESLDSESLTDSPSDDQ